VLIIVEKTGGFSSTYRYFDASTDEKFARAALFLLEENFYEGLYNVPHEVVIYSWYKVDPRHVPEGKEWVHDKVRETLGQLQSFYDQVEEIIKTQDISFAANRTLPKAWVLLIANPCDRDGKSVSYSLEETERI